MVFRNKHGIAALLVSVYCVAHDWMYRVHSRWFKIPAYKFDTIQYAGMMYFKIAVFIIVPYFALCIVG